jgi:hypothetical protein
MHVMSTLQRRKIWNIGPRRAKGERDDVAYFEPLKNLKLPRGTELYLGLVHRTDGIAGARGRLAAAKTVLTDFGVATECGFGRRPPESVSALLDLHRETALLD